MRSLEDEYQRNCVIMKQKLLERTYTEDNLNKWITKVDLIKRKEFLQNYEKITARKTYR